ncbi:Uncharacterised protein [Candidatus Anstonella stagnisolia]|nr:Uncharacterised protein [Candidatus Anstonella stagnisolia]
MQITTVDSSPKFPTAQRTSPISQPAYDAALKYATSQYGATSYFKLAQLGNNSYAAAFSDGTSFYVRRLSISQTGGNFSVQEFGIDAKMLGQLATQQGFFVDYLSNLYGTSPKEGSMHATSSGAVFAAMRRPEHFGATEEYACSISMDAQTGSIALRAYNKEQIRQARSGFSGSQNPFLSAAASDCAALEAWFSSDSAQKYSPSSLENFFSTVARVNTLEQCAPLFGENAAQDMLSTVKTAEFLLNYLSSRISSYEAMLANMNSFFPGSLDSDAVQNALSSLSEIKKALSEPNLSRAQELLFGTSGSMEESAFFSAIATLLNAPGSQGSPMQQIALGPTGSRTPMQQMALDFFNAERDTYFAMLQKVFSPSFKPSTNSPSEVLGGINLPKTTIFLQDAWMRSLERASPTALGNVGIPSLGARPKTSAREEGISFNSSGFSTSVSSTTSVASGNAQDAALLKPAFQSASLLHRCSEAASKLLENSAPDAQLVREFSTLHSSAVATSSSTSSYVRTQLVSRRRDAAINKELDVVGSQLIPFYDSSRFISQNGFSADVAPLLALDAAQAGLMLAGCVVGSKMLTAAKFGKAAALEIKATTATGRLASRAANAAYSELASAKGALWFAGFTAAQNALKYDGFLKGGRLQFPISKDPEFVEFLSTMLSPHTDNEERIAAISNASLQTLKDYIGFGMFAGMGGNVLLRGAEKGIKATAKFALGHKAAIGFATASALTLDSPINAASSQKDAQQQFFIDCCKEFSLGSPSSLQTAREFDLAFSGMDSQVAVSAVDFARQLLKDAQEAYPAQSAPFSFSPEGKEKEIFALAVFSYSAATAEERETLSNELLGSLPSLLDSLDFIGSKSQSAGKSSPFATLQFLKENNLPPFSLLQLAHTVDEGDAQAQGALGSIEKINSHIFSQ